MGLSLKKLGKSILSGLNPLDDKGWTSGPSDTERAQQSIRNAQQQLRDTPAKFGPLTNPQVRQNFLSSSQVPKSNSLLNVSRSIAQAPVNTAKAFQYGVPRSLAGTAEGFSGLYDLATPGTGTNRFTKLAVRGGKNLDEAAQRAGVNPLAYKAAQATTEGASFLAPSATFETLGKLGKAGEALSSTASLIDKPGLRYLSKPATLLNAGVGTVRSAGSRAARGQDVSVQSVGKDFASNLVLGKVLDAAGNKIADPVLGKIADIQNGGELNKLQSEKQALTNEIKTLRSSQATGATEKRLRQARKELDFNSARMKEINQGGYVAVPGGEKPKVSLKNKQGDALTPEAYADTFGVSPEQAAKDLATPPSVPQQATTQLGKVVQPAPAPVSAKTYKEARPQFNDATNQWLGKKAATQTQNIATVRTLPKLDSNSSLGLMDSIERGVETGDFQGAPAQVRGLLDAKYQQLKDAGVDIGYLQNYFPHKWQNASPEEVAQAFQSLNMKNGIMQARTIPTVAEGMQLGFKPTTTDYREAVNNYLNTADKLLANREYFGKLKSQGLIAEAGNRPRGMQVIDAPGLPQPRPFVDPETGSQIQGNYYARPDVANKLNKLFGEQDVNKVLAGTAAASKGIQTVTLAGGLPGTPLNAFGTANWLKQSLSGRPISATKSFLRSFSAEKALAFEQKNLQYVTKMQEAGVPYRGGLDTSSLKSFSDKLADKSGLGKTKAVVTEGWNRAVEDPTFKRFLPAIQLDTFKGVYQKALKSGMDDAAATKVAADATRHAFGLNELTKDALKSKNISNATSTVFFAPRFRESMANFWIDNAKSLGKPGSLAYRENIKFLANATILFGAMQAANMALNGGKTTFQNDNPNDRLNLSIPKGDGKSVSVPFLSSIATVPRMAINTAVDLATGNPKEAGLEAKKSLSQLVRPAVDLATNQKYNGRQIYNSTDSAGQKLKDQAVYAAGQYNHPYIQAAANAVTGKSSGALETAATATELPLRFRNYDTTNSQAKEGNAKKEVADIAKNADKGGTLQKLSNGKYAYTIEGDTRVYQAKDLKTAQDAIAKDAFSKGSEDKKLIRGKYYLKRGDGSVVVEPKVRYETKQTTAKLTLAMDRAYGAKNTKEWASLAQQQFDNLEKLKGTYNPDTEQDQIDKITLQQENLRDKAEKYLAKGIGGSGGSGGSGSAGSVYKYAVSLNAGGSAPRAVSFRKAGKLRGGKTGIATPSKPRVSIKKSLV